MRTMEEARPAGGRIYTIGFVASEAVQTMPSPVEGRSAARRRLAIVPALNEEGSVARVVAEIQAADAGFDVVVVDDGSLDRTAAVAEAAGARVLRLPFNLGIGGAVQTGYRYACARSGLRLVEVPVVMRERAEGRSTLTFARSLWYAAKVLVAVFVSLFRRPVVHHLEEEP
jgi:hypothetical protein